MHVILLGDSVFDNGAYIGRDPDVRQQVEQISSQGLKATLRARDGAVISEIGNQLRGLPPIDATHLIISVEEMMPFAKPVFWMLRLWPLRMP